MDIDVLTLIILVVSNPQMRLAKPHQNINNMNYSFNFFSWTLITKE